MLRHFKSLLLVCLYLPSLAVSFIIVWLDRKLKFKLPFPRDVDELAVKKEWCINALKKGGAIPDHVTVNQILVTPIKQETIFRSNAGIIELGFIQNGENKTQKYFAKFAPVSGTIWNRTIFNAQLNHIKETFFNRYFIMAGDAIPAPAVHYAETSFVTGNLCLITELMDGCVEYTEGVFENFPDWHLQLAIEGMATLHATYWNSSDKRLQKVFPIDSNTVYIFDSLVAFGWSSAARKILVKSWCLMNEPQTVLHGDARVGNMMFPKSDSEGRFVFIDWQAARKGKGVFDLAYFLVLSLTEEHRKETEQKSLETYYERLIAKGVKHYSHQQFEDDYKHACLCVLVLLSLPLLSGEASVEGEGALIFAHGMNIWRERLLSKFNDFDYQWLSKNYGLTETEARNAIAEMLKVIELRLDKVVQENTK